MITKGIVCMLLKSQIHVIINFSTCSANGGTLSYIYKVNPTLENYNIKDCQKNDKDIIAMQQTMDLYRRMCLKIINKDAHVSRQENSKIRNVWKAAVVVWLYQGFNLFLLSLRRCYKVYMS